MSGNFDMKKYSLENKWMAALATALLFVVISSPITYGLTNRVTSLVSKKLALLGPRGAPNLLGLAAHGAVFGLLTRVIMW